MSDTNQAVLSLNMARGLKFRIQKVEGLYYPCSENKGADQLRGKSINKHLLIGSEAYQLRADITTCGMAWG